jgi:uncharacterized DUF497 family protein
VDEQPNALYSVHTPRRQRLEFEWDPKKAEANRRKHGIEFLDAVIVFDDDRAITLVDEHPKEERYLTFGMDAQARLLAVSYAVRRSAMRIISARAATSRERAQYEDRRI